MQAHSIESSAFTQTTVFSLLNFAALALLGSVLAYWTWACLAPRPEPRAQEPVQTGGAVSTAYGLFGSTSRNSNGAAPTGITMGLLGVVAASGDRLGYAVLRLDAKQTVAVHEGDEVEPGVRLAEVHANHVVLERGGLRETLAWSKQSKSESKSAVLAPASALPNTKK